jgi:hypothetical protein
MLADIFPTGYESTELAGVKSGETVVVYGAGPVGLMAAYSCCGEEGDGDWPTSEYRRGMPLKRDGKVVGAIGVSGGSGEQDQAVAEAGVAAFIK